jgi:hypothetical protein
VVVTPDGLPLTYEVLPGNTADCKTLWMFLDKIEQQNGRARRVWARLACSGGEAVGIAGREYGSRYPDGSGAGRNADQRPTGAVLGGNAEGPSVAAGERSAGLAWQQARAGVQVKLLAEDNELYVYAESVDRVTKERAMRKRQMKWLWKRLRELAAMEISREEMLMKLGAARSRALTPTGLSPVGKRQLRLAHSEDFFVQHIDKQ